jgi:hypothetical protein
MCCLLCLPKNTSEFRDVTGASKFVGCFCCLDPEDHRQSVSALLQAVLPANIMPHMDSDSLQMVPSLEGSLL